MELCSYPLHPGKPALGSLVTAEAYREYATAGSGKAPRVPPSVLLCFHAEVVHWAQEAGWTRSERTLGHSMLLPETEPALLALHRVPGIGAPMAAATLEDLIACGLRRCLIVGTAGGLRPELAPGTLVLADQALRDEGTSWHYLPPARSVEASPSLVGELERALEASELSFARGTSWTTDAPYRETVEEVLAHRGAGVLSVEMEAAAVFAVAACRGIEAAALLVLSDVLDERGWVPRFFAPEVETGLSNAARIGLEVLGG